LGKRAWARDAIGFDHGGNPMSKFGARCAEGDAASSGGPSPYQSVGREGMARGRATDGENGDCYRSLSGLLTVITCQPRPDLLSGASMLNQQNTGAINSESARMVGAPPLDREVSARQRSALPSPRLIGSTAKPTREGCLGVPQSCNGVTASS